MGILIGFWNPSVQDVKTVVCTEAIKVSGSCALERHKTDLRNGSKICL